MASKQRVLIQVPASLFNHPTKIEYLNNSLLRKIDICLVIALSEFSFFNELPRLDLVVVRSRW